MSENKKTIQSDAEFFQLALVNGCYFTTPFQVLDRVRQVCFKESGQRNKSTLFAVARALLDNVSFRFGVNKEEVLANKVLPTSPLSTTRIASLTGLSPDTVTGALKELKRLKLFIKQATTNSGTTYHLNLLELGGVRVTKKREKKFTSAASAPGSKDHSGPNKQQGQSAADLTFLLNQVDKKQDQIRMSKNMLESSKKRIAQFIADENPAKQKLEEAARLMIETEIESLSAELSNLQRQHANALANNVQTGSPPAPDKPVKTPVRRIKAKTLKSWTTRILKEIEFVRSRAEAKEIALKLGWQYMFSPNWRVNDTKHAYYQFKNNVNNWTFSRQFSLDDMRLVSDFK